MRKSKLSALEVEESLRAEDNRRQNRLNGLSMAEIRDRGWYRFSNGVTIEWPSDRELYEGEARTHVPEGHFILVFDGQKHVFDADEFDKYRRWV